MLITFAFGLASLHYLPAHGRPATGSYQQSRHTSSPAYDIVPSITRPGVGTAFSLAMSIGDQGRETNMANALDRAARFGFSRDEAKPEVEKLIRIVRGWRDHFSAMGCPDSEVLVLEPSFFHDAKKNRFDYDH